MRGHEKSCLLRHFLFDIINGEHSMKIPDATLSLDHAHAPLDEAEAALTPLTNCSCPAGRVGSRPASSCSQWQSHSGCISYESAADEWHHWHTRSRLSVPGLWMLSFVSIAPFSSPQMTEFQRHSFVRSLSLLTLFWFAYGFCSLRKVE